MHTRIQSNYLHQQPAVKIILFSHTCTKNEQQNSIRTIKRTGTCFVWVIPCILLILILARRVGTMKQVPVISDISILKLNSRSKFTCSAFEDSVIVILQTNILIYMYDSTRPKIKMNKQYQKKCTFVQSSSYFSSSHQYF